MTAAAITASLCDWKNVKTRSVVQLILEVPVEQALLAFQTLGMPQPGSEIPVAVALLRSAAPSADAGITEPDRTHLRSQPAASEGDKDAAPRQRRHFSELPRSTQAAMLCENPVFQDWLLSVNPNAMIPAGCDTSDEVAAFLVRRICGVTSRRQLDVQNDAGHRWDAWHARYRAETGQEAEQRA